MYGGRMFLDHLLAALRNPQSQLFQLDDELPLDVDRYRALLSAETWRRGRSGQLDESTVAWVFRCIADGWVDEHLSDIRDALLELLAIRDADHLDALLCLATQQIVGETDGSRSVADEEAPLLTAADHQLLFIPHFGPGYCHDLELDHATTLRSVTAQGVGGRYKVTVDFRRGA